MHFDLAVTVSQSPILTLNGHTLEAVHMTRLQSITSDDTLR